jgi:uncharacterized protein YjlB
MHERTQELHRKLGLASRDAQRPLEPETLGLDDDGVIPNSRLPVLVYRGEATRAGEAAEAFEALFAAHAWPPQWRGGVFAFQHYHSTAHEVLGVHSGRARVQLGGRNGPIVTLTAGDAVVLPAGTGHCRIEAGDGFGVVGAYPANQPDWDLLREDPAEHEAAVARIARVPHPGQDPVTGADGALVRLWDGEAGRT